MAQPRVVDLFKQIANNEFGFFSRIESVMDLVDSQIPVVSCDENFGRFVGRNDVRSLGTMGVIDPEDRQLIGTLHRSTVQRCFPRFLNTLAEQDGDARILGTSISSLVTRPVPQVPSTASPLETVAQFLESDCDCLFVYDDAKKVIGVVRPVDFLKTMMAYYQIYSQAKPLQRLRLVDLDQLNVDEVFHRGAQTARDIMQPATTLDQRETSLAAIQAMHDQDTDVICLTEDDRHTDSVLTVDDILIALAPPDGVKALAQVANPPSRTDGKPTGKLDLISMEQLRESQDPALQDPVLSTAETTTTTIEPTTRLQDVLSTLTEAEASHVLLIKDGDKVLGTITTRDILRVNKMLFRIKAWADA